MYCHYIGWRIGKCPLPLLLNVRQSICSLTMYDSRMSQFSECRASKIRHSIAGCDTLSAEGVGLDLQSQDRTVYGTPPVWVG